MTDIEARLERLEKLVEQLAKPLDDEKAAKEPLGKAERDVLDDMLGGLKKTILGE